VSLVVYGAMGERVRVIARGEYPAGRHRVVWDGRDDGGREVPPGACFCRFEAAGFRAARRTLRVR
jgi:flagellar hook assembly protein FlgD